MKELFDESHFFMCTGGMKPARFKANQNIAKREDGKYYLTVYSLRCKGIDFACRFMALIGAIIAAAMALLMASGVGVILLAAILGAAMGAGLGAMMCGDLAAMMRTWVVIKNDAEINGHQLVSNRPGTHLTCKVFGNQITYAPNVKNEFTALALFAGNIICTGLEGFMYVYAARGVGLLVKAPSKFICNFATNYLASLTMKGVAMRTVFAGYSAANAHYTSPTEGFDKERVGNAALDGGFFIERAAMRLYDGAFNDGYKDSITGETNWKGALSDAAMMFSMGGIPAGGGRDATSTDVGNMAKQVGAEWRHPVETAKAEVGKVVESARQFRNRLQRLPDGKGAHETAADWRAHENAVTEQLRSSIGEVNVAEQVTLRVRGTDAQGNPIDVTIRADNVVMVKGRYRIIDAKFSRVNNLGDANYNIRNTFTKNQRSAYDAIGGNGNGSVSSVEVRGNGAIRFGIKSGDPITLEKGVGIYYDSPNGAGYRTYP